MNIFWRFAIWVFGQSDPKPFEAGKTYAMNDAQGTVNTLSEWGVQAHVTRSGKVKVDRVSDEYREGTAGIR